MPMPKVRLIARSSCYYAGVTYQAGQSFVADADHAGVLCQIGKAQMAQADQFGGFDEVHTDAKPKRRYRRRDLTAESA